MAAIGEFLGKYDDEKLRILLVEDKATKGHTALTKHCPGPPNFVRAFKLGRLLLRQGLMVMGGRGDRHCGR